MQKTGKTNKNLYNIYHSINIINKGCETMQSNYFSQMSKTKQVLLKMTLVGVFSALSYVGVFIRIPIPSPLGQPMIHLGNLVVILVALFFDGWIGGLSGSIGMGLYDFIAGYDIWSIMRTIILKLVMGIIVGCLYKYLLKKKVTKISYYAMGIGLVFLLVGITFLGIAISSQGVWHIEVINKKVEIHWPVYVLSIIIGLFLTITPVYQKKCSYALQVVNFVTSLAIGVNLLGEFIYKFIKQCTLGGTPFVGSLYVAMASIPATLLNGILTLTIVLFIYLPIQKSLFPKENSLNEN